MYWLFKLKFIFFPICLLVKETITGEELMKFVDAAKAPKAEETQDEIPESTEE